MLSWRAQRHGIQVGMKMTLKLQGSCEDGKLHCRNLTTLNPPEWVIDLCLFSFVLYHQPRDL